MKTTPRKAVLAVIDHAQWIPRRVLAFCGPTISKTSVVFDVVETWVDIAELFADALDEGADIGTIPLGAVSGDEVFAVDQIVNLAVADILTCFLGQQGEDLEFGQGEVEKSSRLDRPADIEAQGKPAELDR